MNGKKKRYKGLAGENDYRKAAELIKAGGYATDTSYVQKLCNIIEKWNLTRFNIGGEQKKDGCPYMVRIEISNLNIRSGPGLNYERTGNFTGIGAFTIVEEKDGWGRLKSGAGWVCLEYCDKIE